MQFTPALVALASLIIVNASPLPSPFSHNNSTTPNIGTCGNQTYNLAMVKIAPDIASLKNTGKLTAISINAGPAQSSVLT